ncbi:MAG: glycosyltransferase [Myxococcota bacterium]|nr:glycosyltransferase [Myxococcota bacterium]
MTKGQVLVSVLIPARNAEATVEAAVASMTSQTLRELEVVVVDDGSSDRTAAIVARLAAADGRIRLIRCEALGLTPALNRALQEARAPWLARMDADDIAYPERLQRQMCLTTEADIIGCGVRIVGAGEGYARYASWLNGLVTHEAMMRERFVESPLAHPSVLMRRATVRELGGYRDMGWAEDYDLWLRAARAGARFAKAPQVLLDWIDRGDRTSRVDDRYGEEAFYACKAHHLLQGPLAEKRCTIWGAGPGGTRLGRALRRQGVTITRYIDIDQKKIGQMRGGSPVIAVADIDRSIDVPILAAVAVRGARELVRAELVSRGFVEATDFWCVA